MTNYDICIIGTGRVGLPLALSFIDKGFNVCGIDQDENTRNIINGGEMPFLEPGYDQLIKSKKLKVYDNFEIIKNCKAILITVGTPLRPHIETDISYIESALESISPYIQKGQLYILRSTVSPHTTMMVKKWLENKNSFRVGEDIFLSFCPERIAEGKAYEELTELPQIIGVEDEESFKRSEAIFKAFGVDIFRTSYINAELVKLYNNIARYVHFSVANQLALVADELGGNIYDIIEMTNHKYHRSKIAFPGFTAGTCLRKDFGMINEWMPTPDLLLSAWKINEFMPNFLVKHIQKRTQITGKKVVILGASFKSNTDDVRDSLVPKLYRYIKREMPNAIMVNDYFLGSMINLDGEMVTNTSLDKIKSEIADIDIIFVGASHSKYSEFLNNLQEGSGTWIADLYNLNKNNQIFYQI